MKVRVYLARRRYRDGASYGFVEREVDSAWWLHVLGVYRDVRRQGATQSSARALIHSVLRSVEAS